MDTKVWMDMMLQQLGNLGLPIDNEILSAFEDTMQTMQTYADLHVKNQVQVQNPGTITFDFETGGLTESREEKLLALIRLDKNSDKFIRMRDLEKIAFWNYIRPLTGMAGTLLVQSYRILDRNVYVRGWYDPHTETPAPGPGRDPRGQPAAVPRSGSGNLVFRFSKEEAKFCCGLQEAVEVGSEPDVLLPILNLALQNCKESKTNIRPQFCLVAGIIYKPVFELLSYHPDQVVRDAYEDFKEEIRKNGLQARLPLQEQLPQEILQADQQRRRAEEDERAEQKKRVAAAVAAAIVPKGTPTTDIWVENVTTGSIRLRIDTGGGMELPAGKTICLTAIFPSGLHETSNYKECLQKGWLKIVPAPKATPWGKGPAKF